MKVKTLERILKENDRKKYIRNKNIGIIDNNNLYQIKYSDKVFKLQRETKGRKYKVMLSLDVSGSMTYNYETLIKQTISLQKSLRELNIDLCVFIYATLIKMVKDFGGKDISEEELKREIETVYKENTDHLAIIFMKEQTKKYNKEFTIINIIMTDGEYHPNEFSLLNSELDNEALKSTNWGDFSKIDNSIYEYNYERFDEPLSLKYAWENYGIDFRYIPRNLDPLIKSLERMPNTYLFGIRIHGYQDKESYGYVNIKKRFSELYKNNILIHNDELVNYDKIVSKVIGRVIKNKK